MSERITDIEIKLMHLEVQLEDMNAVVLAQAEEITALRRTLARTEGKIENLSNEGDGGQNSLIDALANEKPPHY